MPINHPFGNGKHTTYKNGDDCGMVDDIVLPTLVVKNGEIRMNNSECASFLNPYHLNVAMVDKLEDLRVPWCLRGSFLMNLTGSLIVSSVFHCGLTTAQRLENSLAGFILLDLGSMLAAETALERGVPKQNCWLHHATHNNLQQLSGCMAIACISYPASLPFKPWASCAWRNTLAHCATSTKAARWPSEITFTQRPGR